MSKSRIFKILSISLLSLAAVIPATATTVTLTGGMTSGEASASSTDFESGVPAGYTFSAVDSGVVIGSLLNVYASPAGDSSHYAYVGPSGSASAVFASPITYFGMYWGTPDTFNTITFTDVNGVSTSYAPGSGLLSGLDTAAHTAAYVNFYDGGAAWASVSFLSGDAAFEFDNISSIAAPSPEPATLALLAGGLLTVGLFRRRKSA